MLVYILDFNFQLGDSNQLGQTALHTAAIFGSNQAFSALLPKVDESVLSKQDIVGYTALNYAIINNNFKIAKQLFSFRKAITFYIKP